MKKLFTHAGSIAVVFVLLFSQGVLAQSVIIKNDGQIIECSKDALAKSDKKAYLNAIVEEDYPYLNTLSCLENGYFADRWKTNFRLRNLSQNNVTHYVLKGRGSNIEVEAMYDHEGNLIEATLISKDTQIPVPILRYIYSDEEFAGWVMVSNEKIVKDFDSYQTEYRVTLSNGDETEVLHFRERGESIAVLEQR